MTLLYHVTHTRLVPAIQKSGLRPGQASNWVKAASGRQYGSGKLFAFEHPEDAVRWAAKTDYAFNGTTGSGKVSIVTIRPGSERWVKDVADPLSQAGAKGAWLKTTAAIAPGQIVGTTPVTLAMTRALVAGKPLRLRGDTGRWVTMHGTHVFIKGD